MEELTTGPLFPLESSREWERSDEPRDRAADANYGLLLRALLQAVGEVRWWWWSSSSGRALALAMDTDANLTYRTNTSITKQAAHWGLTLRVLDHYGAEGRAHRFYNLLRPALEALVSRLALLEQRRPRGVGGGGGGQEREAAARAFAGAALRRVLRERWTQTKKLLLLEDMLLPLLKVGG